MLDQRSQNEYREELPKGCPPKDAGPIPSQLLLRLVDSQNVGEAAFDSHIALGCTCPDPSKLCQCSHVLCS